MPELCTGIPDCITAEEIRTATIEDKHITMLSEYVL